MNPTNRPNARVDLSDVLDADGDGVHWTLTDSTDLNANLVRLEGEHRIDEHVNSEVDVLLVVLAGSGHSVVDGEGIELTRNVVVLVPQGSVREIVAGPTGLAYLTVHRRRPGPRIGRRPPTER